MVMNMIIINLSLLYYIIYFYNIIIYETYPEFPKTINFKVTFLLLYEILPLVLLTPILLLL